MLLKSISVVYRLREVKNAIVLILPEALFLKKYLSMYSLSRVMTLSHEGYNLKPHECYEKPLPSLLNKE
ncbi:hypothetical protein MCU_00305 [Bartonella elizabethae Re6043vi]|uniref:Uncharacterized protein n=1 Tax=Bartonella elizabethae Re6043vi TaxID=1094554 RepID=A0ABN0GMB0_BAREL|nr:hypothetical protein MCU_00305 [Bartonella elizabethae Re6043vi]